MTYRHPVRAFVAFSTLALATPALADDIYPGDYAVLPKGTNLALAYTGYSWNRDLNLKDAGNAKNSTDVPASSYDLQLNVLRVLRYEQIGNTPIGIQAYIPIGFFSNEKIGGVGQRSKGGIGDVTLGFTAFPVNGAAKPGGTTIGLTAYVKLPTGNYDARAPFNLGGGTWAFNPQLGVIQNLGGGFSLDAMGEVTLRPKHTDHGIRVKESAAWNTQAILRYNSSPTTFYALGYANRWGGKQKFNDVTTGIRNGNDQVRAYAGTFVNPRTQVSGMIATDVGKAEGNFKNDFSVQLRLIRVF